MSALPARLLRSAIVAVEQAAETAEDRAFLAAPALRGRCCLVDPVGHAAERQRLQPCTTRPGQRGEEQSFSPEQRGLDLAHELDVVADRRLERDETARVHAQRLAGCEIDRVQRASGVNEAEPVPLQTLHDEPFAAKQAD